MLAPMLSASSVHCLRIRTCAFFHQSSSIARNVPINFTSDGITLVVWPPWNEQIESTDGLNGLLFLLTICCSATTNWDATKMVSTVRWGAAACPPGPLIVI